jgi:hypothetical protein
MAPRTRKTAQNKTERVDSRENVEAVEKAHQAAGPNPYEDPKDARNVEPTPAPTGGGQDLGELVGAEVTFKADSEKIGMVPGEKPKVRATDQFEYPVVVKPIGPNNDVAPGPDTAAVTAAMNAGLRPVGEASVKSVEPHADGVSAVVTWVVPCVRASSPEARDPEQIGR